MKYPNNINKEFTKQINHANRGMDLENLINKTNEYYLDKNIAVIYKKPTPIGVVKVNYENKKKIIDKAYFKCPSTLDYNGIYKGKYIEFDAKETVKKTSFPLSNIYEHQINHIRKIIEHNGIVFLIIRISDIIYLLNGCDLIDFIDNNERKSIPSYYLTEKGYIIKENYLIGIDYLKIIDEIYKGEIL